MDPILIRVPAAFKVWGWLRQKKRPGEGYYLGRSSSYKRGARAIADFERAIRFLVPTRRGPEKQEEENRLKAEGR